ncbi:aminoglycoside phosphotransferase family protein [Paenarthrobacter sp. Z7-10]|uniref:aminoglycoside phosphotransferase family protein n=1 Tax=Paenarthrobacter sp. Z7-10 TaxID=2787635 RepID=UPI002E78CB89|nr:aminoglycoside phosphotransferase family protein [Paenarthrobacter sp. Z7-10]MCZ2404727.1 aminoglycoside phosphotransferase family protein [Paenarthrobacter sp. Z7-10]
MNGAHQLQRPWHHVRTTAERVLNGLWDCATPGPGALRPVRDWCGAARWPQLVAEITAPLDRAVAGAAERIVADVLSAEESGSKVLVHGDFGLQNFLWNGADFSGLIDLDNACIGDPAMDLAPLIGTFGTAAVADIAQGELLERAGIHRASLSLQVAAAAQLANDCKLRDFAVQNFTNRFNNGTLYDPNGLRPS